MTAQADRIVQYSKVSIALAGYVLLSVFVLAITVLTYQHGNGLGDWRNLATVVPLFGVFLISARLALDTWQSR